MATSLVLAQQPLGSTHTPVTDAGRPARPRRIGLFGYGRIGRAVAEAAPAAGHRCEVALVRDAAPDRGTSTRLVTDPAAVLDAGLDVIVEVLGGVHPACTLVSAALERGIPVVTANKSLVAEYGPELRALAAARGVTFAYEAAVVAGVPFVAALAARPRLAAVAAITGILNGTSHVITTALERGGRFASALADAQARGFAEPDSDADISGRDAAEKLTILLQLCGARDVRPADIHRVGLDTVDAEDFAAARALGGHVKPMAHAVLSGEGAGTWVGPAWVDGAHALAPFHGVTNALRLQPRTGQPILFAGPGAGPDVTAGTILDDIAQIHSPGSLGAAGASGWCAATGLKRRIPSGAWFLRVGGGALSAGHLAEFLAGQQVPAVRLEAGAFGWAVRTADTTWAAVASAADTLRAMGISVAVLPALTGEGER